ncbi:MAG: branched-chain amino acid ABC transporter permease [Anaerolineales bacterium]|nr:branched-chain amino acid ABC transporter permease [Anaerolineales bacterium]
MMKATKSNPFRANLPLIGVILALILVPFVVALMDGQSVGAVFASEAGNAKFVQGLLIEIFILAVYAISYDLIMGITGLLSFGHAMFFGVGAYLTGIMLKSFGWGLFPTLGVVVVAGVVQALLFSVVLPRVQGLTFALVTLGMAVVFHIVIRSRELGDYTGADVGLQGVVTPAFINASNERFTFYVVALAFMFLVYLLYKRFVDSPTGRVCIAIRENESRAKMLGYNTFYFKVVALTISSITAALAGTLHTLFQPIVSPDVASLAFTISALLMVLFGGVGTLSGALFGAAIFKLLSYGLDRFLGENSSVVIGLVYIAIVLFLPYGVVGTWHLKRAERMKGGVAQIP